MTAAEAEPVRTCPRRRFGTKLGVFALTPGEPEDIDARAAPLSFRHTKVDDAAIDALRGMIDDTNYMPYLNKLASTCFSLVREEPQWCVACSCCDGPDACRSFRICFGRSVERFLNASKLKTSAGYFTVDAHVIAYESMARFPASIDGFTHIGRGPAGQLELVQRFTGGTQCESDPRTKMSAEVRYWCDPAAVHACALRLARHAMQLLPRYSMKVDEGPCTFAIFIKTNAVCALQHHPDLRPADP